MLNPLISAVTPSDPKTPAVRSPLPSAAQEDRGLKARVDLDARTQNFANALDEAFQPQKTVFGRASDALRDNAVHTGQTRSRPAETLNKPARQDAQTAAPAKVKNEPGPSPRENATSERNAETRTRSESRMAPPRKAESRMAEPRKAGRSSANNGFEVDGDDQGEREAETESQSERSASGRGVDAAAIGFATLQNASGQPGWIPSEANRIPAHPGSGPMPFVPHPAAGGSTVGAPVTLAQTMTGLDAKPARLATGSPGLHSGATPSALPKSGMDVLSPEMAGLLPGTGAASLAIFDGSFKANAGADGLSLLQSQVSAHTDSPAQGGVVRGSPIPLDARIAPAFEQVEMTFEPAPVPLDGLQPQSLLLPQHGPHSLGLGTANELRGHLDLVLEDATDRALQPPNAASDAPSTFGALIGSLNDQAKQADSSFSALSAAPVFNVTAPAIGQGLAPGTSSTPALSTQVDGVGTGAIFKTRLNEALADPSGRDARPAQPSAPFTFPEAITAFQSQDTAAGTQPGGPAGSGGADIRIAEGTAQKNEVSSFGGGLLGTRAGSQGESRSDSQGGQQGSGQGSQHSLHTVNEHGVRPDTLMKSDAPAFAAPAEAKALGRAGATDDAQARALTKAAFSRAQGLSDELQARGGGMARVQIRDSRLGVVALKVNMGAERTVHIEISASDETIKRELEKGVDELKASLDRQSLALGDVKIISDAKLAGNDSQQQGERGQRNPDPQGSPFQQGGQSPQGQGQRPSHQQGEAWAGNAFGSVPSAANPSRQKRSENHNSAGIDRQKIVNRGANGSLKVIA